jgi:hypothetical protein
MPRASRISKIGTQSTLVDSMTTVSTPHSANSPPADADHREGTEAAYRFRRAICIHRSHTHGGPDDNSGRVRMDHRYRAADPVRRLFRLIANPPVKGEGLGCAIDQFPKRDRRTASPPCATTHGQCFFAGYHATKKPSAAPFHQEDRPQSFLRAQADAVRDGFSEVRLSTERYS